MNAVMEFAHAPVLAQECMRELDIKPDGIYVDGTLGGGGHAEMILERLPQGKLIGIDRDSDAITAANARLSAYRQFRAFKGNFMDARSILKGIGVERIDGVLLDLGVSSWQLDNPERGFSYMQDAPLDMRMDAAQRLKAYDVVNEYAMEDLIRIIRDYGEERWAVRIAEFICGEREKQAIKTTGELVRVIKAAIPKGARRDGPHPAKRTFQAIRIEVNGELTELKRSIMDFADMLKPLGRICVITFHSLEDAIVKAAYRELEKGCICPPKSPVCVCGMEPSLKIMKRKGVLPSRQEVEYNPRARSAKLRAAMKI